jgi:hypothetical protein
MKSQDIPQDELQELQALLQLKNYERPRDGYFEDFLDEFHRRQRLEKQGEVSRDGLSTKLANWFQGLGAARWAIGAAGAYAALFLAFLALPETQPGDEMASETEEILPGDRRLEHVDLEKEVEEKDSEEILKILPSEF